MSADLREGGGGGVRHRLPEGVPQLHHSSLPCHSPSAASRLHGDKVGRVKLEMIYLTSAIFADVFHPTTLAAS